MWKVRSHCLNCDKIIKKSDNFCNSCGGKTPFGRELCVQCRFPTEEEDSFCKNCGQCLIKIKVTENE